MSAATTHDRAGELIRYINLKLAALGQPISATTADPYFLELARPLLRNYQAKDRLLAGSLCAADARIQSFLDSYLHDVCPTGAPRLPSQTFTLDRPGLARILSLPATGDSFSSPYLKSYRIPQGVLHNPHSDRRTSQGMFHIVEGGLPIPADKIAVPREVFAKLLDSALHPHEDALTLPFTSDQTEQCRLFVSLLLRPLVCPATGTEPASPSKSDSLPPPASSAISISWNRSSATPAIRISPKTMRLSTSSTGLAIPGA